MKPTKPDYWVKTPDASSCVIVLHEVWGLVPHTSEVCKQVGKLGFAAHAPNLYRGHDAVLSPDNIQAAMESVWELTLEERRDKKKVAEVLERKNADEGTRLVATLLYDQSFRDSLLSIATSAVEDAKRTYDQVVTLGFCMGGGLSLKTAASTGSLTSAVSYYGEPPALEMLKKVNVPVLVMYAEKDEIINSKVPSFVEDALKLGVDVTLKTYPRTKHGFFNDSRKAVYDRKAAIDSWSLTKWFLRRTIGRH